MVAGHTYAIRVHNSEIELGIDLSLLSRRTIPPRGLIVVLGDALSISIHPAEYGHPLVLEVGQQARKPWLLCAMSATMDYTM